MKLFIFGLVIIFGCFYQSLIKLSSAQETGVTAPDSNNITNENYDLGTIINIFQQTVLGGPFLVAADVITRACYFILHSGLVRPRITPDINQMHFQLIGENCINISVPLLQAENLWNMAEFDHDKDTVLYISGWKTSYAQPNSYSEMAKAYNCRNDSNFVVLDAANFINTFYAWSALNTEEIGRNVAIGLQKLSNVYDIDRVHLIGHSLGAQIASATGRYYQQMAKRQLKRITGLDPANPCFYEDPVLPGLQSSDAVFVDIIHTNPGVLGTSKALGHADFFVGGYAPIQFGCFDIVCSHERSILYYAESVYPGNEYDFTATYCQTLSAVVVANCKGTNETMGYIVSTNSSGNYYVEVNPIEPFGKNATENFVPAGSNCGRCPRQI